MVKQWSTAIINGPVSNLSHLYMAVFIASINGFSDDEDDVSVSDLADTGTIGDSENEVFSRVFRNRLHITSSFFSRISAGSRSTWKMNQSTINKYTDHRVH